LEFDPLPNRPDLLSWRGLVCEIGILLNYPTKPFNPPIIRESKENLIEVEITTNNCLELHLGLIKNIALKASSG
jgi:hypothetical protein